MSNFFKSLKKKRDKQRECVHGSTEIVLASRRFPNLGISPEEDWEIERCLDCEKETTKGFSGEIK